MALWGPNWLEAYCYACTPLPWVFEKGVGRTGGWTVDHPSDVSWIGGNSSGFVSKFETSRSYTSVHRMLLGCRVTGKKILIDSKTASVPNKGRRRLLPWNNCMAEKRDLLYADCSERTWLQEDYGQLRRFCLATVSLHSLFIDRPHSDVSFKRLARFFTSCFVYFTQSLIEWSRAMDSTRSAAILATVSFPI